ncbi:unnamed protein product [Bemisia tabaci]|uniref:Uncharacterized protein n=1 Tax=Bemisia tabaci TaxID=7038 RepID=A0A9P0ACF7_BEMTA|nr:unnamed protein product [Bemisia tabaci]
MDQINNHVLYVPIRSIHPSELHRGERFPLEKMIRINTEYGETILAYIDYHGTQRKIYLPKSYSDTVTDDGLREINQKQLDIVFVGPHHKTYRYRVEPRE